MVTEPYEWPVRKQFLGREEDLAGLGRWWESNDREALALYGRRRVGKSWLLRAFAHGKPALVLVADQGAPGRQLDRFADALEPHLDIDPTYPTLPPSFGCCTGLAAAVA